MASSPHGGTPTAHQILDASHLDVEENLETSQGSFGKLLAAGSKPFFIDPNDEDELDVDELKSSSVSNQVTESLNYWRRQRKVLANARSGQTPRNEDGTQAEFSVSARTVEEESFYYVWLEKKELARLLQEERAAEGIRKWLRFDSIFGIVVLVNGVWLGIQTQEGDLNWPTLWWVLVDTVFAILFTVEWGLRWYYNPRGLYGMLRDGWTLFDLIVVVMSWMDLMLDVLFSSLEVNTSTIVALRSVRLLRMAKLVQLVRHLQEIWILIHGLTVSIRLIGWALLTFVGICYMFALMVLSTADGNDYLDTPEGHALWGGVYRCMLTLAQLAFFGESEVARVLAEDHVGSFLLVIFLAFIVIASFCLLNLITGLIMTSTLVIENEEESFQLCTQRLLEHRALRALRELLVLNFKQTGMEKIPIVTLENLTDLCNSKAPLRKSPVLGDAENRARVASETFENAVQMRVINDLEEEEPDEPGMASSLTNQFKRINSFITGSVGAGSEHFKSASSFFEAAGVTVDDIRAIFGQIHSVLGYERPLSIDEFIQNCMWLKGKVHCLDVMHLLVGYSSIHERFNALDESVSTVSAVLVDVDQMVTKELVKFNSKAHHHTSEFTRQISNPTAHVDLDEHHPMDDDGQKLKPGLAVREHAAQLAFQQRNIKEKQRCWDRFDFISSMVIFSNMLAVGFEVAFAEDVQRNYLSEKFDKDAVAWLALEAAFVFIYAVELVVRTVWYYQLEVLQDFRMVRGFLPRLLFVMDWPMKLKVIGIFRLLIQTPGTLMALDLLIVVVSFLDLFVVRLLDEDLVGLMDATRCMVILRLIRSVRLVKLIRPLFSLVKAFLINIASVSWSFIILATMIYSAAILMVVLVGFFPDAKTNPQVEKHWSHILSAMLALAQMITYENLRGGMWELSQISWLCWAICVILVAISSWAVLNLVVGMMVQASFTCVLTENASKMQGKIITIRPDILKEIQKAHEAIEERIGRRSFWVRDYIQGLRQAVEDLKRHEEEAAASSAQGSKTFPGEVSEYFGDSAMKDSLDPWQYISHPSEKQAHQIRRKSPRGVTHVTTVEKKGKNGKGAKNKPEIIKPCSSHDDDNYCTIVSAIWISSKDLAINFELVQDKSPGPIRDPKKSILIWDSVRVNAGVFLPETQMLKRNAVNVGADFGIRDADFKENEGMQNINRVEINEDRGDLIFFDVPKGARKYRFRFGGNYSTVEINNIEYPPGLNDMVEEVDFKELILTDRDYLSIREVLQVQRSHTLRRKLKEIGLAAENILTVFQKLNGNATGLVRVNDVVDGLLRLRTSQLGVDVAGGKSNIRRLISEVAQLEKNALDSAYCCCDIVQSLRGVEIVDEAEPVTINSCQSRTSSRESTASSFVAEIEQNLLKDVQHLEHKVQNVRRYYSRYKEFYRQQWKNRNPRSQLDDSADLLDPGMRENTNASAQTITSAAPGWD